MSAPAPASPRALAAVDRLFGAQRTEPSPAPAGPEKPAYIYEEVLKDGTKLGIRPVTHDDKAALQQIIAGLDREGQRTRFFGGGVTEYTERQLQRLTEPFGPAQKNHYGIIAVKVAADGTEVPIGAARLDRLRPDEPAHPMHGTFEASCEVAKEASGQGVGKKLLGQLAQLAAAHGVDSVLVETLRGNRAAVAVVEGAFPGAKVKSNEDGTEIHWERPKAK